VHLLLVINIKLNYLNNKYRTEKLIKKDIATEKKKISPLLL